MTVSGPTEIDGNQIWLAHEHILVDFIGADSINPDDWEHDSVIAVMLPFLEQAVQNDVSVFVDPTPAFLGRDPLLLKKISEKTGLKVLTNTGLYGVRNNKYIPKYAFTSTAEALAENWINEFKNGIYPTGIKPGFIKISVDVNDPLDPMHQKIVKAAGLTYLKTGLTIYSHTGPAEALWPQLEILESLGVPMDAFVWVHAQNDDVMENLLKASETGCWISLDGLGWEIENHIEKLLYAKQNGFLDQIIISHDAGWFDPQKSAQDIVPYTDIFEKVIPRLVEAGFSGDEIDLLLKENPARALAIDSLN